MFSSRKPHPTAEVSLHGLSPEATYLVRHESTGQTRQVMGAELMATLHLEITDKHRSDLITYQRQR
jgi:hypothetical protein